MSGFNNGTVYGSNVDFTGNAQPTPQIVSNGQLLIGSTAAPNIQAGFLTSIDGSVVITNGPGTINLKANSSGITVTQHALLVGGAGNTITSVTPGSVGFVPTSNGASVDPSFQGVGLGVFGDGSDGTPTWDGSTVVLGITPSANAYTLARDIFLGSSTINSGVSIISNGYRIFCNGTLTNNGTIQWNGNNGSVGAGGGAALANSNSSINTNVQAGSAGGSGATGAGSAGTTPSGPINLGGQGATGGTGGSAGGAAGGVSALTAIMGGIRAYGLFSLSRLLRGDGTNQGYVGGTGGGGGGGDGVHAGGGGGSGAGMIELFVLYFAGTGNISAIGGTGGAGAVGGTNAGGGGGGGGGLIILASRSVVSAAVAGQTISVAGGAGGAGTGGATGGTGSNGLAVILPM